MRSLRVLVRTLALSMPLLFGTVAFNPGALAQTQDEYDAKIAAFSAKLRTVENSKADTDQRVACLNQRDTQLTSQRKELETSVGNLRTQEQELTGNVVRLQSEYEGFAANLRTEQDRLNDMGLELNELQRQKQAQEDWIRQCQAEKDWHRLWGLTCEADMNIAKTFGQIKSYEGDIAAATRKEQIARESMEYARSKRDASVHTRDEIIKHAGEIDEAIRQTEASLVTVSKNLSDVRALKQPFQRVIGEFTVALNEATDVNFGEKRRRTLSLLSFIEKEADGALNNHTSAIVQTENSLGPGWMKTCVAQ